MSWERVRKNEEDPRPLGAAGVLSLASGNEANRKCVGMGKADRSAEQYDVVRPGLAQLVAAGYVQHHAKRHASAGLKRNRLGIIYDLSHL